MIFPTSFHPPLPNQSADLITFSQRASFATGAPLVPLAKPPPLPAAGAYGTFRAATLYAAPRDNCGPTGGKGSERARTHARPARGTHTHYSSPFGRPIDSYTGNGTRCRRKRRRPFTATGTRRSRLMRGVIAEAHARWKSAGGRTSGSRPAADRRFLSENFDGGVN